MIMDESIANLLLDADSFFYAWLFTLWTRR